MSFSADLLDPTPISELREGVLHARRLASGKTVFVARRGDAVHVFHDTCPHMGADLAEARYCEKTGTIHCKWHGYVFAVEDGRFLENPNEKFMRCLRVPSEHYRPDKTPPYRLAMVPTVVKEGRIVVGRDASAPTRPTSPSSPTSQPAPGDEP